MSAQVAADLRAAAEVLRRDGWTQEAFHRRADETRICHCTEGAIDVVTGVHHSFTFDESVEGGVDWRTENYSPIADGRALAAERFLANFLKVRSIPGWNDTPERTADEVIDTLEAAAEAAEQQATPQSGDQP